MSITPFIAVDTIEPSSVPISNGKTLYVGGSGPGNYTSIQDAIDDASDGDTVFVYNGTYYETVDVDKSINLIGENKDITEIINSDGDLYAVDISADYVNISGFTIDGDTSSTCTGIEISGSSNNNTIIGNIILNNYWGIYLSSSNNNTIKNNNLSDNHQDIILEENCMNNIIAGNTLLNTMWCYSISIQSSSYNTIIDNTFSNGEGCDCGCVNLYSSDKNVVMNNTITSMPIGNGIYIHNSKENIIIGNTIKDLPLEVRSGIYLSSATDNTITSNNLICCYTGISTKKEYASNDNTIYHNNFFNNTQNAYDEGNNTWDNDYPSGGNYWDDYNGIDDDGDGIGDTPYNISGGDNQDRYPLMKPWNHPPDAPTIDGPTFGEVEVENNYTFVSLDMDGDDIFYWIDWGDDNNTGWIGPYPVGEEIYRSHSWSEIGTYKIRAKAKDFWCESDWSEKLVMIYGIYELEIDGPTHGRPGITYYYNFSIDDYDGYWGLEIDWGDGTKQLKGYFVSGHNITVGHCWEEKGTYVIRANAIDMWGGIIARNELKVTIPRIRISANSLFIHLLDRFPFLEVIILRAMNLLR